MEDEVAGMYREGVRRPRPRDTRPCPPRTPSQGYVDLIIHYEARLGHGLLVDLKLSDDDQTLPSAPHEAV